MRLAGVGYIRLFSGTAAIVHVFKQPTCRFMWPNFVAVCVIVLRPFFSLDSKEFFAQDGLMIMGTACISCFTIINGN